MLDGKIVRLEPLERRHEDGLRAAAAHPEIWTWLGPYPAADDAAWEEWMRDALRRDDQQAFATVAVADGTVLGSTRYLSLRPADRGLEIGWTWLTPAAWQTGANVEAKLLALDYAFTRLRCIRVELKTHASNARSRGAMTAMGATFEGVHRKHRVGRGNRDPRQRVVLRARRRVAGGAGRAGGAPQRASRARLVSRTSRSLLGPWPGASGSSTVPGSPATSSREP